MTYTIPWWQVAVLGGAAALFGWTLAWLQYLLLLSMRRRPRRRAPATVVDFPTGRHGPNGLRAAGADRTMLLPHVRQPDREQVSGR